MCPFWHNNVAKIQRTDYTNWNPEKEVDHNYNENHFCSIDLIDATRKFVLISGLKRCSYNIWTNQNHMSTNNAINLEIANQNYEQGDYDKRKINRQSNSSLHELVCEIRRAEKMWGKFKTGVHNRHHSDVQTRPNNERGDRSYQCKSLGEDFSVTNGSHNAIISINGGHWHDCQRKTRPHLHHVTLKLACDVTVKPATFQGSTQS